MKKIIISQSIMWAAAILVVAILDDTNFEILLLVVLATISILNLNKAKQLELMKVKFGKNSLYKKELQILKKLIRKNQSIQIQVLNQHFFSC